MNITALNVANNILKRAFAEDIDITPMKLQKIIFCTYKEYLKKQGFHYLKKILKRGDMVPFFLVSTTSLNIEVRIK